MQELVYCLSYVLEHMDLMRNWVDIEVEMVGVCVINPRCACAARVTVVVLCVCVCLSVP